MVRLFTLLVTLMAWSSALHAEGDVAYGEYLSTACVTCHQLTGIDNGIPSIVGWDQKSFIHTLRSYQSKQRKNPVMQMITEPMTDEEMEALAAYFATIKPKEQPE
jgi:cytochrome c